MANTCRAAQWRSSSDKMLIGSLGLFNSTKQLAASVEMQTLLPFFCQWRDICGGVLGRQVGEHCKSLFRPPVCYCPRAYCLPLFSLCLRHLYSDTQPAWRSSRLTLSSHNRQDSVLTANQWSSKQVSSAFSTSWVLHGWPLAKLVM